MIFCKNTFLFFFFSFLLLLLLLLLLILLIIIIIVIVVDRSHISICINTLNLTFRAYAGAVLEEAHVNTIGNGWGVHA